jgi:hypothetical protein
MQYKERVQEALQDVNVLMIDMDIYRIKNIFQKSM